jgi:hypothetical protein
MEDQEEKHFQVEIEPDEQDIVQRPNVFFYKSTYCKVVKEEDGTLTTTLPPHIQVTFRIRQGNKRTIDDCFARQRCYDTDKIEIRESLVGASNYLYGRFERVRFPDGKVVLNFEKPKREFDEVYVDALKDHIEIYPVYKEEDKAEE